VFFDTLKWSWTYEPQGFELPEGNYLPDFWVEQLGAYLEIKPSDAVIKSRDWFCVHQLPNATGKPAWMVVGQPWPLAHEIYTSSILANPDPTIYGEIFNTFADCRRCNGVTLLSDRSDTEIGLVAELPVGVHTCEPHDKFAINPLDLEGGRTYTAYRAARSARFEYGEQGACGG